MTQFPVTRHRYRYSVTEAAAVGVEMHPIKDIMLWAPDATDIVSVPKAESWLFTANTLRTIPPYVEVMHAPATAAECAAASAAGLQVCSTCGDWVPREWHDFECGGHGHHFVPLDAVAVPPRALSASVTPRTRTELDGEWKRARVGVIAAFVVIVVAVFVFYMLATHGGRVWT